MNYKFILLVSHSFLYQTLTIHMTYQALKKVANRIGAMYEYKNFLPMKYYEMFANLFMFP